MATALAIVGEAVVCGGNRETPAADELRKH
jgi:hypothetical protein